MDINKRERKSSSHIGQKNKVSIVQQLVSASCGSFVTNIVTYPLDVIKTQLQYTKKHGTIQSNQVYHVTKNLIQTQGLKRLWSGLPPTLIMQLPASGIYITMYENGRDYLYGTKGYNYYKASLISGVLSRTLAVMAIGPLELVRTNMQVMGTQHRNFLSILQTAVQNHGWRSLWTGTSATLIRDVPFTSLYWCLMEYLRDKIKKLPSRENHDLSNSFAAALVAASVSTIITHPIDVIKTRMQGNMAHRTSFRVVAQHVYQERAFFGGLAPRLARVAPACGIMIATYEFFKGVWNQNE